MGDVCDLIGHHRAAVARVVGPAEHAGLEERSVYDKLATALEQVEQARLPWSVELIILLHRQPRHPPTLRGQRVPGPGQLLLLH